MEYIYQTKRKAFLQSFFDNLMDFIAPRTCEVCKKYIGNKSRRFEFLCDNCFDRINLAPPPEEIINKLNSGFDVDSLAISNAYSLFSMKEDHDFMNLIYSLKYYSAFRIGTELGVALGEIVKKYKSVDYDYIVPVPIHHARLRERGYNQSFYIALGVNQVINSKINSKAIKRVKYTQTQTALGHDKRKHNISGAIKKYKNANLENTRILLVDDVLTTGSTVNVCANTLLESGAKQVDIATIVYA